MKIKNVFLDTCLLMADHLPEAGRFADRWGENLGFEILPMFDLPAYQSALDSCLHIFEGHRVTFHGPVFCAEHSAPKGSPEYEETMRHVNLLLPYINYLHGEHFVMHLNNCRVIPEKKAEMLRNALANYAELCEILDRYSCPVCVENTGTALQENILLDQQEFTDLCRSEHFNVLVDIGHANANGWDIPKLIRDLKGQITAYHLHNNDGVHDQHNRVHDGTIDYLNILKVIREETPDAKKIIEYTRPALLGDWINEDIEELLRES